ncbi:MAG TPA: biotin/lipoyl-containing protein [Acidobacteriaceae bacterium]
MTPLLVEVEVDGVMRRLSVDRQENGCVVLLDERTIPVDIYEPMPGVLSLVIGGRSYRCVRSAMMDEETIAVGARQYRVAVTDRRSLRGQRKRPGAGNGALQIKASMPGRVARVLVTQGDTVRAHQGVVVIEAMKMQNELKAPREGRVKELRVAAGDKVASGQVLAVIE